LQRELKSLGCYNGEINGVWTTSTRQAMKTFTDRANAKLPVTEPDQVLLALIKGNRHFGCNERLIQAVTTQPLLLHKTAKPPPVELAPLLAPPMALAGPKTTETDGGNIAAPPEELAPKTSRRRVVAGSSRERSEEHWSAKLWTNAGN
jgi:peptidoglycan hydrolase-like protein with peptidoglycan-binding domain